MTWNWQSGFFFFSSSFSIWRQLFHYLLPTFVFFFVRTKLSLWLILTYSMCLLLTPLHFEEFLYLEHLLPSNAVPCCCFICIDLPRSHWDFIMVQREQSHLCLLCPTSLQTGTRRDRKVWCWKRSMPSQGSCWTTEQINTQALQMPAACRARSSL